MTIHKEGRGLLSVLIILLLALNLVLSHYFPEQSTMLYIMAGASFIFFILVLQFFRSPSIKVPENPSHILAPADGKVVVVEKTVENEYFKDERIQISIFMSPVDVHVNRSPVKGVVKLFKYHPGKYLVAWHPKSSTENERTTMVLTLDTGGEILVRQIAGVLARRIKYYITAGERLQQGEEFGFIKFGSRLDVFLPPGSKINVKKGTQTKAGVTVLAEI